MVVLEMPCNIFRPKKKENILVCLFLFLSPILTLAFSSPSSARNENAFIPKKSASAAKIQAKPIVSITTQELSITDLAIAGALAAILGDVSLHPIDCIKTIQQSDIGFGMNLLDATKYIWENFGIMGFYNGLGPYIVGDSIGSAMKFSTYEYLKNWASKNFPANDMGLSIFLCAGLSFLVASTVIVPGELIKQKMQMGQITSIAQGIKTVYESDGILGLYTGFTPLCMRDVPYTMLELGVYDSLKRLYTIAKNRDTEEGAKCRNLTQIEEIYAAAITGGFAGCLTTPFDTIKTKLMVDDQMIYSGFIDCVLKTINEFGIESMFQGGTARVAWLVPFTAIYLPCYDLIKRKLEDIKAKSLS